MNDLPTLHRPAQWVKRLLDIALGSLGALGFLVLLPLLALAQVILALYQDRALGQSLGSSGRDRVEQDFTPRAAGRKYAELLEQVVAE
jgi:glycosyltransferase involved in cell wall biosynthesis